MLDSESSGLQWANIIVFVNVGISFRISYMVLKRYFC